MVTEYCSFDGMHVRGWDTVTNTNTETGTWVERSGTFTGTNAYPNTVWVGYYTSTPRRYNPCFQFSTIAIEPGASIASAKLQLYMAKAFNNVQFNVKHYADPDSPTPSPTYSSDFQPLGVAVTFYNSERDANSGTEGFWDPADSPLELDVTAHLQELVNHPNWASGKKVVFVLRTALYNSGGVSAYNDDNDGAYIIYSTEHATANEARLVYTTTLIPVLTKVGGDDSILADEKNVTITGRNLSGANALRIYKGAINYPQTLSTISDQLLTFNTAGNIPTGTGYTLEATIDTAIATRSIDVINEVIVVENVTEGTALTAVDGHEYVVTATGFPGAWETKSSLGSTTYFTDGIIVGKWIDNSFKASIKFGPIAVDNAANIYLAELRLNVINNYKYNDLRIRAVADPNAADIGAANIISSQSLTNSVVNVDNATWANENAIGNWVQAVNPKNIDITAVFQEVINHANWSSGDHIQIVIDFADYGGLQGYTRLGTNDESAANASTIYFAVDAGTTITSVSGDNIIELGELNCTIVGKNLSGASTLVIAKGAISEAQTISSNTDTNIIFNVTTGAIVADTGYTLSFDIGATTYTHTVEFVSGGGVNTGSTDPDLDGYEDTVTGTWYDEYVAQNVNIIGYSPFLTAQRGMAVAKIGPITAQRGQTFSTGNLTWACDWIQGAFKGFTMRIYAVANPAASDVGSGNLPSAQSLTTAYLEVDTGTWAGADPFSYWQPGAEVLDIKSIVQEVVGHANWVNGGYVQLVFQAFDYYSGDAGVSFNSTESASTLLSFSYVTAAATNIASINGTNEIHVSDTGVRLLGNDLGSATALSITDGTYTTTQTILTNTSTEITFDFAQGSLGYTASAVLSVTIGGIPYTFGCALLPAVGRSYVVIGTAGTGDNSLTYNDDPALGSGDVIDYTTVSTNGFVVSVSTAGIPTIDGGSEQDTFTARAYIASTGTWYDLQTITFYPASYFVRNSAPLLEFGTLMGVGSVVNSGDFTKVDPSETWIVQNDTDDLELWT
jgi:hypothetical protein